MEIRSIILTLDKIKFEENTIILFKKEVILAFIIPNPSLNYS